MDPIWYYRGLNTNYRKIWESRSLRWISDICDYCWNVLTKDQLQTEFKIGINVVDYEHLKFSVKKRLLRYNLCKRILTVPNLPVILHMIRIVAKGCSNVYKQLLGTNTNVINAIQAKWSTKIYEETEFRSVADSFKIIYRTTCDTYSQII